MDETEFQDFCLSELISTTSLKWIFVGGKGGVGKTTTSCAIASKLAEERESVLILSTDPAHNLSDAFSQKFSSTPTLVNGYKNLYAMELDTSFTESAEFKLGGLSNSKTPDFGLSSVLPEIIQAVPGIDEALSFAELMQAVQSMRFSTIVFDTAPTGHTLRLLSFPDLLEKGLSKLSALKDKIGAALGMVNAISGQNVKSDDFASKLDNLRAVTTTVREAFQDPTHTTFVCVCIPEFLSVYETERLVQELAKQGIDCSNIVVNQVLFPIGNDIRNEDYISSISNIPAVDSVEAAEILLKEPQPKLENETADDESKRLRQHVIELQKRLMVLEKTYVSRRRMQSKYLEQIQDLYGFDFHIVCIPQQREEVRGMERIQQFANLLSTSRGIPIIQKRKD